MILLSEDTQGAAAHVKNASKMRMNAEMFGLLLVLER
jgi:hypothetical protein